MTECDSDTGITTGLIDGTIAIMRIIKTRDLTSLEVKEALVDLKEFLNDW
jgi:hypothetical protein